MIDFAVLALNDAPDPQLNGRSALFYERGFNPVKPVDIVQQLQLATKKDTCPVEVIDRVKYITEMRNTIRDAIYEAERSYVTHYNSNDRMTIQSKLDPSYD